MLTLKIRNTLKGTPKNAHYTYQVLVNQREIASGEIGGHNRDDGWAVLVKMIAEQEMGKVREFQEILEGFMREEKE